jgi:hypothetical protein
MAEFKDFQKKWILDLHNIKRKLHGADDLELDENVS